MTFRDRTSFQRRAWIGFCVLVMGMPAFAQSADGSPLAPHEHVRRAGPIAALAGFVPNAGQWSEDVLFVARRGGIEATLFRDALAFRPLRDLDRDEPLLAALMLRLPEGVELVDGEGVLPTQHHFLNQVPTVTHVQGFERVIYRDVAPGIDLVLRTDDAYFAYDLHVAPGADLDALTLTFEGATAPRVRTDCVLEVDTAHGVVEQRIGAAWQIDPKSGARTDIPSSFRLPTSVGEGVRLGFSAPGRNLEAPFVLDPTLVYTTYVGGSSQEYLNDMDVGPDGAVYLTGRATPAPDAPTTIGAYQPETAGEYDAWLGKLSPDGSTLEWGTFLGGSLTEEPFGVHVDHDGSVVVTGNTWSVDFPTTPESVQPIIGGTPNSEIFVTRLAPDGSYIIWSTFYGGPSLDPFRGSALMPSGDVLIATSPDDPTPPATPGAYDNVWSDTDQALIRISADGTTLVFQTYFNSGAIRAFAFDSESNIYYGGSVGTTLPSTPGTFQEQPTPGGTGGDAFIAKMNATGTQLLWATYLGGSKSDSIQGMAIDATGAVYVTG